MSQQVISKADIARSFGSAAESYDQSAHFQRWVGNELLGKIGDGAYASIADIGCGTGYFSESLLAKSSISNAMYLGLDLAENMLKYGKEKRGAENTVWLCGDLESLPLKEGSVDLAYSSLAVQWCSSLDLMFGEVYKSLKPGGVFAFATLLNGTLVELKESWKEADSYQHVNEFASQQEYRTAITNSGLATLSLEHVKHVLRYSKVRDLTRELKGIGAHNISEKRPVGLTGKSRVLKFVDTYEKYREKDGMLPATYELLFGVLSKPEIS